MDVPPLRSCAVWRVLVDRAFPLEHSSRWYRTMPPGCPESQRCPGGLLPELCVGSPMLVDSMLLLERTRPFPLRSPLDSPDLWQGTGMDFPASNARSLLLVEGAAPLGYTSPVPCTPSLNCSGCEQRRGNLLPSFHELAHISAMQSLWPPRICPDERAGRALD